MVSVRGGVGNLGIQVADPTSTGNYAISCAACARKIHYGAPRIHGELLKLGFTVAQSEVSKYMA
jgi:hypothetical protein